jgi:GNAT superfamily N-acetyltransferase
LTYRIGLEGALETVDEITPLYLSHYAEMRERLSGIGVVYGEAQPDMRRYEAHAKAGTLLHFVLRFDGEAVGYANIFLGPNLHNGETEAAEDAIYIHPDHRGRMGRHLMARIVSECKARGAKRLRVGATTDPRAENLWRRMGFTPVSTVMIHEFGDEHVRT